MKKYLLSFILSVFIIVAGFSQQLVQVNYANGSDLQYFSLNGSQDAILRISSTGSLLEYGVEREVSRFSYTSPNLMPFVGRVDLFGTEALPGLEGKVKSLGTTYINWYTNMDRDYQDGKIKSVGNTLLDYYSNFDDKAYAGKLKKIGGMEVTYYSSFDNVVLSGKLKSIGNIQVQYFSSFDDKLIQGKIKSIGNYNWQWYSGRDSRDYQGSIKSGSYRQAVNGIIFTII
ncbi:MAG: hypothetical protein ABIT96_09470 [Ferruginibacter sp.]